MGRCGLEEPHRTEASVQGSRRSIPVVAEEDNNRQWAAMVRVCPPARGTNGRGAPVGITDGADGRVWVALGTSQELLASARSSSVDPTARSALRRTWLGRREATGPIARIISPTGEMIKHRLSETLERSSLDHGGRDGNLCFTQCGAVGGQFRGSTERA